VRLRNLLTAPPPTPILRIHPQGSQIFPSPFPTPELPLRAGPVKKSSLTGPKKSVNWNFGLWKALSGGYALVGQRTRQTGIRFLEN